MSVVRRYWNMPGTGQQVEIAAEESAADAVIASLNDLVDSCKVGAYTLHSDAAAIIHGDAASTHKFKITVDGVPYYFLATTNGLQVLP